MVTRTLIQALAGLAFVALPALGWAGQPQRAASPFAGEYFCTRNADAICVPFTRNLNQFRRIDFDVCHPRLSEKYPQFTRPAWEEIPFDLAMAERIVKNLSWYPDEGERWWQVWLKASEPLRTDGKIKLWQTRIDVDGDGGGRPLFGLTVRWLPMGEMKSPRQWSRIRAHIVTTSSICRIRRMTALRTGSTGAQFTLPTLSASLEREYRLVSRMGTMLPAD